MCTLLWCRSSSRKYFDNCFGIVVAEFFDLRHRLRSQTFQEWLMSERLNILFVLKSGQGSQLSVIHVLYYSLFFFFQSVLHYNNHAFSKDYHDTIESKKDPNRRFGQRESFSRHDIKQINQLYGCDVENLNNLLQDVPFN